MKDNPPLTYPEGADLVEVAGPWRAAYTRPRQEKTLAWDLYRQQIAYFLPMVQRETVSGGRRRRGLYPLFASYVFFAGDETQRLAALKTERIVQLIEPKPAQQEEFQRQLAAICTAVRSSPQTVELHPRLVQGARVTIRAGAMKGYEGVVINDRNKKKLWIEISLLGVGATVEIGADLLDAS